jgi:hypothetical protein
MLAKFLFNYTANLPCRRIDRDVGKRYLERYYLFEWLGFTAYLHRFVDADREEETHDHPFTALAICLSGWYREQRLTHVNLPDSPSLVDRIIKPGSFNFIRGGGLNRGDFHRIVDARPDTWTLFIRGGRLSSWGFLRKIHTRVFYIHFLEAVKPMTEPFDGAFLHDWHLRAPIGRDADRAPFGGL